MATRSTIATVIGALLLGLSGLSAAAAPADPFVGLWKSVDTDGSDQTLTFSGPDDATRVRLFDQHATGGACDPAGPATLEGTGEVSADGTTIVVTFDSLVCPQGEELLELPIAVTFVHDPETDTLTDDFGVVWHRPRSTPSSDAFFGTWVSTDLDGSEQTLSFAGQGDTRVVRYVDENATEACDDGGRFTAWGHGTVDGSTIAVTLERVRCDDRTDRSDLVGSVITYVHDPDTDTLTDDFGVVWHRA